MANLKTRKQLRIESSTLAAELAELKSPEGLARYMFSLQGDQEYEDRFRAELRKLSLEIGGEDHEDHEEAAPHDGTIAEAIAEVAADSAPDASEPEPEPYRYRVMYVDHEAMELKPLLDGGFEITGTEPFSEDDMVAIAAKTGVDRIDLQVEHRAH